MTNFKVTYSSAFEETAFVESTINGWRENAQHFTLTTSGSTGNPKKIKLSKELLIWSATSTHQALALGGEQSISIFCCLPVQKTGGFMQLIRALHYSCHIHFEKPSSNPIHNYMDLPFTLTSFTPHQMACILGSEGQKLGSFEHILLGGGRISTDIEKPLIAHSQGGKFLLLGNLRHDGNRQPHCTKKTGYGPLFATAKWSRHNTTTRRNTDRNT